MDSFESIKKIIAKIRDESKLIKTEDGLLKFDSSDAQILLNSVSAIREDHKKERLRLAIKMVLDLGEKDMVIFRQNEIFIKHFSKESLIDNKIISVIKDVVKASEQASNTEVVSDTITISLSELGSDMLNLTESSKEKIKQKIKAQSNLSEKDLILFLNDKVVIRKFKGQVSESENPKIEQRYNGLPKEELAVLKKSLFENIESEQEIVCDIVKTLLRNELDFRRISHSNFAKNYIKILQGGIFEFLKENLSEEDFVLEGLTNFILRDNWIIAHTTMAINILDLLASKNTNVENFIKNYSGDIEVDADRNKFKLPEIIDKNGMKWILPSITSIILQRNKTLEQIGLKQKAIDDIKISTQELHSKIAEINRESIEIAEEYERLEADSKEKTEIEAATNLHIKELREQIKNAPEDEKVKIQAEISDKTLFLKKLIVKEDALFTRTKKLEHQNKTIAIRIEKLNFEISKSNKRCKEEEEKLRQFITSQQSVNEKYELLLEALAVALMKKKSKI